MSRTRPYLALVAVAVAIAVAACGSGAVESQDGATGATVSEPVAATQSSGADWSDVYAQGVTFAAFIEAADQRRETWHNNFAQAQVPEGVLERARSVPGSWQVLVVAEDWCGDSANTIPYLARLVADVDGLDMRIVTSDVGAAVAKAHPTPDGRSATPTVVLLDSSGRDVGCWVERPSSLQEWFLGAQGTVEDETLYDRKYAWYDWDVGNSTVSEITDVIAAAAAGDPICG